MRNENDTAYEQIIRAAWLYHVAGNTQEQTAELLGISRVKVNRLLAEAREEGIVKMSIEHRFGRMIEVEETIRKRHKLSFCRTTPPLLSYVTGRKRSLASRARLEQEAPSPAGRLALWRLICSATDYKRMRALSLAWDLAEDHRGNPNFLNTMSKPRAKFVSAMGSLTRSSAANPFEVVGRFAEKTGGEGHFLPVPFIVDSLADKQIFMSQRVFKQTLALAEQASFYVVTLGQCDEYSLLFRHRLLSGLELQDLKRAGAVCDCMGKFFDANGQIVASELNERTLAVDLEYLYEREVILLCAGREKLKALKGLLKAGFVTGLIIDGDTALDLCKE